jgi:hypothetical protein
MKTKEKHLFLFIFLIMIGLLGCTRHITPLKFDIDSSTIPNFYGKMPIAVIVPESADKEYLVEYADPEKTGTAKIYVDLNDLYKNAKELIEMELSKHEINSSQSAEKQIKFTITKAQWEVWAGGFAIGAYLEFDIETKDGYKAHYRVQDGSSMDVSRAIGGTVSRAVEKIFQDDQIIKYFEE